ncbi:MAG: glycosyltransferase [Patescibacteria group bacterium]
MRIAIFHNYLDNIGGAEIVALTLARGLAADVYTTNIDAAKIRLMGFADVLPRIFSIGRLPKKAPFRQQLAFWRFRRLDLRGRYDFFIIAGDWAMSAAVNHRPNLWYVHSPLNELWEFRDFIRTNILSAWKVSPYDFWVWFNRRLTLKYARTVDIWVANSENTRRRLQRFYGHDATVINPPVDTAAYRWAEPRGYWLSVNRLITHKRIDLQVKAFRELPAEKLLIVGSYEEGVEQFESYKNYIDGIKPANVEIIHWADDRRLKELYAGCRGFITTAKDEDFGMTVVEAMAAGKPVIAPAEGGYLETVTPETGELIADIDPGKLAAAIKKIGAALQAMPEYYITACQNRAAKFATDVFLSKIKKLIA